MMAKPRILVMATRKPMVEYCAATAWDWYMAMAMVGGMEPLSMSLRVIGSRPSLVHSRFNFEGGLGSAGCSGFCGSWEGMVVCFGGSACLGVSLLLADCELGSSSILGLKWPAVLGKWKLLSVALSWFASEIGVHNAGT